MKFKPRAWQQEALSRWLQQKQGIVSVVTGGGKTVFAEACLLSFFKDHPDGQAFIVVPTSALMDQWQASLQDELGVEAAQIALLGGGERPKRSAPITVAIVNSARRLEGRWGRLDAPKMLIVDECHRVGSPENSKALLGEYSATLGLSATPERQYDAGFADYIAPVLGPIIFEYDYVQARGDGIIAPFALHNVQVAMLSDEQEKYDALTRRIRIAGARQDADDPQSSEYLKRLLQQRAAVSATATMRIPVAVHLIEQHRSERAIIFHERRDAADRILSLLRERGHSASIYHAGIGGAIRRENLRLFRRGVHDVLVCCRALDEGMNVPETSVAVIASSTASQRQRIQRLGRILRPAKGKDSATVYTLYATEEERNRLIKEAAELKQVSSVTWHESRRRSDG